MTRLRIPRGLVPVVLALLIVFAAPFIPASGGSGGDVNDEGIGSVSAALTPTPTFEALGVDLRMEGRIADLGSLGGSSSAVSCEEEGDSLGVLPFDRLPLVLEDTGGLSEPAGLGAVTFGLSFDDSAACVNLYPGKEVGSFLCVVQDSSNSDLNGIARIECVIDDTWPTTGVQEGIIAIIEVKPHR